MIWLYRFTGNERYPEPVAEIHALASISRDGGRPFLLLGDVTHVRPPLAGERAKPGDVVYLCTSECGRLRILGHAQLAELHRGSTPPIVAPIYGELRDRFFRAITEVVLFPGGPRTAEEVGVSPEEEESFLKGQAYVKCLDDASREIRRPLGLAIGEVGMGPEFFGPLPDDLIAAFQGDE